MTFHQNSALLNWWTIFTLLVTCLILTATLGLQPAWFTPFHLFWAYNLLYFVFVDIFHSLAIPLIMARKIPWEHPRSKICKFYVRKCEVLEPRQPISIHSEIGSSEGAAWMRTPSSAVDPPTLVLPQNQSTLEEGTPEKFSRLCKVPPYSMCCSFHLIACKDTESKAANETPSGKKTLDNQNNLDDLPSVQKLDLLSLECTSSILITQGQRLRDQNSKKKQKSKSGLVFPKQAFRSGPPKDVDLSAAEMKIWKSTNEFGQKVLRYSRHHCTPVKIEC